MILYNFLFHKELLSEITYLQVSQSAASYFANVNMSRADWLVSCLNGRYLSRVQLVTSVGIFALQVHAYRAALERALVKSDPRLRHAGLRSVNKAHTLTFPE